MKYLFTLLVSTSLWAAPVDFMPPHKLAIPVDAPTGITEAQFNAIIDKAESIYAPIVALKGHTLKIERLWKNTTVNAQAEQIGNDWVVRMFGGMARYRTMNEEAFSLVLCHEIGHHLGGAPKFVSALLWASNEGQSDYFSSLKCTRQLWDEIDNSTLLANRPVPPALLNLCQQAWTTTHDRDMCLRTGLGALAIGELLALNRRFRLPIPKFEKPEVLEVDETNEGHNSPQCRLDTFIAGAMCPRHFSEAVSFETELSGTCHALNGDQIGLRPRCWFMPQAQ